MACFFQPLAPAEATHYRDMPHFPNAYLQVPDPDGGYDLVKLHKISYVNSDGDAVQVYRDRYGQDHNPHWRDQASLNMGEQMAFMIPQPEDGRLKQVTSADIRIEGPGNNDDFRYNLWQTGFIHREGSAYQFTGYTRASFMLDKPDSMTEEDWTAGPDGKSGMLVWLTLHFDDGTEMRHLLVAEISGTCEPEFVERGDSCIAP